MSLSVTNSSFDLDFGQFLSDKFFVHDDNSDAFRVVRWFLLPTLRAFGYSHAQHVPLALQHFPSLFSAAFFHVALQDVFHAG